MGHEIRFYFFHMISMIHNSEEKSIFRRNFLFSKNLHKGRSRTKQQRHDQAPPRRAGTSGGRGGQGGSAWLAAGGGLCMPLFVVEEHEKDCLALSLDRWFVGKECKCRCSTNKQRTWMRLRDRVAGDGNRMCVWVPTTFSKRLGAYTYLLAQECV